MFHHAEASAGANMSRGKSGSGHANRRVADLEEENEVLSRENARLRSQFDDAMKISKQIEDVHNSNRKLVKESKAVRAESDELRHKLEISVNANNDLRVKLENEKKSALRQCEDERNAIRREMECFKGRSKTEMDACCAQMQDFQTMQEQFDVERRVIASKISKATANASRCFGCGFRSFDEVIDYLGVAELEVARLSQSVVSVPVTANAQQSCDRKMQRQRAQLKSAIAENESLHEEIQKTNREHSDTERVLKQEIAQLKRKQQEIVDEHRLEEAGKNGVIGRLEAKVDSLTSELAEKRAEIQKLSTSDAIAHVTRTMTSVGQQPPPLPVCVCTNTKKEKKERFDVFSDELLLQNDQMRTQLRHEQEKSREYLEKLKETVERASRLEIFVEKQKAELHEVLTIYEASKKEVEMMRAVLYTREEKVDVDEKERMSQQLRKRRAQVSGLENTIDAQKQRIQELSYELEGRDRTIETRDAKIAELKEGKKEQMSEISKLKANVAMVEDEMRNKPVLHPEDVIPTHAWTYPTFGPELNGCIAQIATNDMQPASKLRYIYKEVNEYFNQIIESRNAALDQSYTESRRIREFVHEFLVSLSVEIGMEAVTFDMFVSSNASEVIVRRISEIVAVCEAHRRRAEELGSAMDHFHSEHNLTHDGSLVSAVKNIDQLKETMKQQEASLHRSKRRCKELSKALKMTKTGAKEDAVDMASELEAMATRIEYLTEQLDEANSSNVELKRNLQAVTLEFRDFKEIQEDATATSSELHERTVGGMKYATEKLASELNEQLGDARQQVVDKTNALEDARDAIKRLGHKVKGQANTIRDVKNELVVVKQKANEKENALIESFENQKCQLITGRDETIAALSKQCDGHRAYIEKLAKDLAAAEQRVAKGNTTITDMKRANRKVAEDTRAQKEQFERERQLAKADTRAAVLNAETKCMAKASEQKAKVEQERRAVFAFAADTFREFYDPRDSMDEHSFKALVGRVSDELVRLTREEGSVRRLVQAGQSQRTPDAVAQALMSKE